ncbi:MAG: hypothetical protein A3E82_00785 [Gammaproteobacteria bacterium RIFCSPHIGHO2_12_FULL_38_11]|nr:MAG: hypothetical protein A3E82_00785 [Gammaproteobacteria bacterium RIFCSPHIGHO2_12_FULL_38_11]
MESRRDQLSALSDELLCITSKSLKPADFIRLSATSKRCYGLFYEERHLALRCLRQLLNHAALGEWEDAEGLWQSFPDLLTCRGTIYHPNRIAIDEDREVLFNIPLDINPGRYKYINVTAWQIALMNEEYEEAERMGACMTNEEKREQFAEVFPDGNMIKYNWNLKQAEQLLLAVCNEVIKDPLINENDLSKMSASTRLARQALIEYVRPQVEHTSGHVFDVNLYIKALALYEDQLRHFKTWGQRSFWNIKIEEWLAASLGTGYLRPHAQGIANGLRRTGCILTDGSSYFAFRRPLDSLPGSHFFVGYFGRPYCLLFSHVAARLNAISKLMSRKNESRDRIYAAIFQNRIAGVSNLLK